MWVSAIKVMASDWETDPEMYTIRLKDPGRVPSSRAPQASRPSYSRSRRCRKARSTIVVVMMSSGVRGSATTKPVVTDASLNCSNSNWLLRATSIARRYALPSSCIFRAGVPKRE